MKRSSYDVIVIGGGLVGSAIAYGLARGAARVAMLDEGDIAHRAARGNFGLIWIQGKGLGLPSYATWTRLSGRRWPELAKALREDTGIDVALAQPGGLHLALSESELDDRARFVERFMSQAGMERYRLELLDHAAVARMLPAIGPDVAGASYCPLDGHVDPLALLRALHAGFTVHGGRYLADHPVLAIGSHSGAYRVRTTQTTLDGGRIVLAAGLGNAALARMVGLVAPVRPERGQIIVLERMPPFLSMPTASLRQTAQGTVLIGDSHEDVGYADATTIRTLAGMAARALRAFPRLRAARFTRAWGALRVLTPDGFPLYEASSSHANAFIATCHSGVTLAAAHAIDLAPQIAAGKLDDTVRSFSARRFGVQPAN